MYLTARGSGVSIQYSALHRYYHLDFLTIAKMDEIQAANRMKDLPILMKNERLHMAVAMWGTGDDKPGGRKVVKRGRR